MAKITFNDEEIGICYICGDPAKVEWEDGYFDVKYCERCALDLGLPGIKVEEANDDLPDDEEI